MSDLSRSRTTVNAPTATAMEADALRPLLRSWLPAQRWFAGKGHPITDVTPVAVTELESDTPLLHLLIEVEQQPPHGSPTRDLYQLLIGVRAELPDELGSAALGRITGGPHDGLTAYDAVYDPEHARRLLGMLAGAERVGMLSCGTLPGAEIPLGLTPRVGTAEQSNTSVVYGKALILKLFRRISPGVNPDLELSLALARSGSDRLPAPLAWMEMVTPGGDQEDPATLALLQRFLAGGRDGWEWALEHVARLKAGNTAELDNFSAESLLLGRATAEVHLALARELPVTVLPRAEVEELAAGMTGRLEAAALGVPALRPYVPALRDTFRELAAESGRTLRAQRIHGDLHLGQAMRTGSGWVLLDFEGEPARPLAERRRPQPAVRDVAAMLRSFDYAAAHASEADGAAEAWAARNREAYCAGYAAASGDDPRADPLLLRAYETDKAIYEVLYEAHHRPSWLPIPMSAIRRLAGHARQDRET
jgi:maltokinase